MGDPGQSMMRLSCLLLVFALVVLGASRARAQPAHELVPPRMLGDASVPYPGGAHGEATVRLLIVVKADGSVGDVIAEAGEEPFATAARTAAAAWRFEPATRDGQPLAARIRSEVHFSEPPPSETEPASAPAGAADGGAPPPPKIEAVQEVTVRGDRVAPGATSIGRAEVRQLPGAFGDPFRALDALPGVTPIVSGLPFFYVRGAPPGNVGYFIDGVKVPYLFHAGAGPSVIHPAMVDTVELHPGGYPARFGRFAGGIVSATSAEPRPELHGEGNIRLFDMGALAETGFADGRGTALVGGRYSYTALILSLIAGDTRLDYRDFQGRLTYDVTPKDRLSLFTFGAYDLVAQTTNGIESVLFGSEFYRLDLRYDHRFGPDTTSRVAVTGGFDQSHIPGQPRNSQNKLGQARFSIDHRASDTVRFRGGADAMIEDYTADERPYSDPDDPTAKQFNALFPARDDLTTGVWSDVVLQLGIWQIVPGLRLDLYNSGDATAIGVDPRLASRIDVTKRVHVIHTFGIAHQPPSFLIPVPGLAIGSLRGGLQRAIQSSAGVETELPEDFTATFTVFDNIFQNMSDTLGVSRDPGDSAFSDTRSLGSAVGAEVYLRRKLTKRVGGYVSYTLSRSTRSVGTEHFLSTFDRTHVANAAIAFDLGKNWRAGTRFTIYTGTPLVPPGGNGLVAPPRSLNPDRDPTFYRLDLRLEKRWYLSRPKGSWIAFVIEVMNATLHKETLQGQEIGPVTIPSIGVEGGL